jgi:hypothetical protein
MNAQSLEQCVAYIRHSNKYSLLQSLIVTHLVHSKEEKLLAAFSNSLSNFFISHQQVTCGGT